MTLIKGRGQRVWHIRQFSLFVGHCGSLVYGTYQSQEVETLPNEGVCKKCRQEWEQRND